MGKLRLLGYVVGPPQEMHEKMQNYLKVQEHRDVQWLRGPRKLPFTLVS